MKGWSLWALGCALLVACESEDGGGPGRLCLQMGCVPTVFFELSPPASGAGSWELELRAGDVVERCTLTLGEPQASEEHDGAVSGPTTSVAFSTGCERLGASGLNNEGQLAGLMFTPAAETGADPETGELTFTGLPGHVALKVSESGSGSVAGEVDEDVVYVPTEINGPGCGTCPYATVNVTMTW